MAGTVKSISSLRATPSQMPVSPVSSSKATSPTGISSALRAPTSPSRGLPPIGVSDAKQPAPAESTSPFSTKFSTAWSSVGKYMMSYKVQTSAPKFSAEYVRSASDFSSLWSRFLQDFGPGTLRTYQTPKGSQDLYEYQYRNLLQFGDIKGPPMVSRFEYRDGRWWNTFTRQSTLNKLSYVDVYSTVPSALKTSVATNFLPTEEELDLLYASAVKNNLSDIAYRGLVDTFTASRISTAMATHATSVLPILEGKAGGSAFLRTSASMDSVFGKFSPQAADFAAITNQMKQIGQSLAEQRTAGQSSFAIGSLSDMLFDSMESSGSGALTAVSAALTALAGIYGITKSGWDASGGWATYMTAMQSLLLGKTIIAAAVQQFLGGNKQHTFHLTTSDGRPVDKWDDVHPDDRAAIWQLAAGTGWTRSDPGSALGKYGLNEIGISPNKIAGRLGQYYRFRALEFLNDVMTADSQFSGNFGSVSIPEFYGRQ